MHHQTVIFPQLKAGLQDRLRGICSGSRLAADDEDDDEESDHLTVAPDGAGGEEGRRGGKYLLPPCITTLNQIDLRKQTFCAILFFFVTVCAAAAAKTNTAEKALVSLSQQLSVEAGGSSRLHSPGGAQGTDSLAQNVVLWLQSARQKGDENDAMWTRSLFFFVLLT